MTDRARTVFLGTGEFAVPVVTALAEHSGVELVAAVTAPSRPGSRGKVSDPPVALWAQEHGVPVLRPVRLRAPESVSEIRALDPALLVLADYGQIVPAALLDLPRHGALNLHPSLLPRYRGATPIPAAILAGDTDSGVTLMRMDEGLDTGAIVAQWHHQLSGRETAPELGAELAATAAALLNATITHWLGGEIEPVPQNEKDATVTRPLRREDGRLDPALTAAALERQVRAYQPWPGSFVETHGDRLVVWRAHPLTNGGSVAVGALVRTAEGGLGLGCSDGSLELDEVQPQGGRRMSGSDLLRGRPGLAGSQVVVPADRGT